MRRLFFVLSALMVVALLSVTIVQAQAYGHGGWGGGTYYPPYRGAPLWSYYTGDYGDYYTPRMPPLPPPRHYSPYHVPYRQYYAPSPVVYRHGHGEVYVGRVHVVW